MPDDKIGVLNRGIQRIFRGAVFHLSCTVLVRTPGDQQGGIARPGERPGDKRRWGGIDVKISASYAGQVAQGSQTGNHEPFIEPVARNHALLREPGIGRIRECQGIIGCGVDAGVLHDFTESVEPERHVQCRQAGKGEIGLFHLINNNSRPDKEERRLAVHRGKQGAVVSYGNISDV